MIRSLSARNTHLNGVVQLPASKSISNRVLILRALSGQLTPIQNLSDAEDTQVLLRLLEAPVDTYDVGHAGTAFRFLLSYLCLQPGRYMLTGSARMQQRPTGPLVAALRSLGANISYLNKEGYPPLLIEGGQLEQSSQIIIPATVSSQFISSLLMIAPVLPHGLQLTLEGDIVSRSYIEMTLSLMAGFGISHEWQGQEIRIPPQPYHMKPYTVEADWSAASYFYALAALSESASISLPGLQKDSLQGDAAIADIMEKLHVSTVFTADGVHLTKKTGNLPAMIEWDFLNCPDIAQTVAVTCAALGVKGLFTGLETLSVKETDRIAALRTELTKIGSDFVRFTPHLAQESPKTQYYVNPGTSGPVSGVPVFDTYEDHRMAMAFAPLSLLYEIGIREPDVVRKSFPGFWTEVEKLLV